MRSDERPSNGAAQAAPLPPEKVGPAVPPPPSVSIDLGKVRPNELGRIPIVMYHSVGARGKIDKLGLNITSDTFRNHLESMRRHGWYPVNMRDVMTGAMNVPAGKTPVVLTFDDARESQFRYEKNGKIDPDCALGILEAFHAKYPTAWPRKATFYVVPGSKYNPIPFWQPGQEAKKLNFLVNNGYEVANHSTTHHLMRGMDPKTVRWEIEQCTRSIRRLAPGATMDTMALPYGVGPRDPAARQVILETNKCILLAGGNPSVPPMHKKFNVRAVDRINVAPGELEGWLRTMPKSRRFAPFISDGDPNVVTVPESQKSLLVDAKLGGRRVIAYADRATPTRPTKPLKPLKTASKAR